MSNQLLTDAKSAEIRALLEAGEAWQVQQLVQIGFPCIDSYDILKKRVQKRQDDPDTWTHLGYKEERKSPYWFRGFFGRCGACRASLLSDPHEAFSCGHLDCPCQNASYCSICGLSFDQLWEFLSKEPKASNIEWPAIPDDLFDHMKLIQFSNSVMETHKMALQQVRVEALVSFALGISSTGVASLLESHRDLVSTVKKNRDNPLRVAWERACRVATDLKLLEKALEVGLSDKPEQSDVLETIKSFFHTMVSPIGEMFEAYSLPEFLERIALLSRRLVRTGTLTTDFTVYNEIKEGDRDLLVESWRQRSYNIDRCYSGYLVSGDWVHVSQVIQTCKTRANDVADICFVYPHLGTTFLELLQNLKLHGDLLSYRIILIGLANCLGQDVTSSYRETLDKEEEGNVPELPFGL